MDQPRGHRRESVGRHVPNTMAERTRKYVGCGGTAPSPSLELLEVATATPSSHRDPRNARVPSGAVALGDPCDSTGGGPPPFPITLLA